MLRSDSGPSLRSAVTALQIAAPSRGIQGWALSGLSDGQVTERAGRSHPWDHRNNTASTYIAFVDAYGLRVIHSLRTKAAGGLNTGNPRAQVPSERSTP